MDFVVDNYLWFIVGVVVILMIIIGYIAEQTDFGRKPFGKKKEKVEKVKEEKIEESVADADVVVAEPAVDIQSEELEIENSIADGDGSEELSEIEVGLEQPVVENFEESISGEETSVIDEMTGLDIPEIESAEDNKSDIIEEIAPDTNESEEDDVWKF